ncbi:uncharacterized protein RCO7_11434 [Rhynchosporium graminicola]|uniref:Helicase ATP-binding domain-containing protein n=1 Tax=Rhynchosporium graminicola TaxID=2792576 RepID=A0A1E1LJB8_9HELO|nr:uncharacterized protein RCO7_11434 [Rhynchosporium commune]
MDVDTTRPAYDHNNGNAGGDANGSGSDYQDTTAAIKAEVANRQRTRLQVNGHPKGRKRGPLLDIARHSHGYYSTSHALPLPSYNDKTKTRVVLSEGHIASPKAIITPTTDSRCSYLSLSLRQARQEGLAASITKEMFSAKEQANFSLESASEHIEDELDLVALAEQSNHSYHTLNHAYAGTTALIASAVLHRNYRVPRAGVRSSGSIRSSKGKDPEALQRRYYCKYLMLLNMAKMRRKGEYSGAALLALARRLYNVLYNEPDLQCRVPGQRNGVLAIKGPQPAEQVVLVIELARAKQWSSCLRLQLRIPGLQSRFFSNGSSALASLVIVSAEAAYTQGFLTYCYFQVRKQRLDRIVIDESHLTITASDYRPCMAQLGWSVRQVELDHARDLIIIYCRTREGLAQLADILKCPLYTSSTESEEEKAAVVFKWLVQADEPDKLIDFSQEARRAERDESKASSIKLMDTFP